MSRLAVSLFAVGLEDRDLASRLAKMAGFRNGIGPFRREDNSGAYAPGRAGGM